MTCIVGLINNNSLYLGADSSINDYNGNRILLEPKVFMRGQFVIGSAGSLRVLQLIKYKMRIPAINSRKPMKYFVTSFVDSLRKCLKISGAAKSEEGKEEEQENDILIGFRKKLYHIDTSYSVTEVVDNYTAIGSGESYALGSLCATINVSAEDRIIKALETASYFSDSVNPPFNIVRMDY